MTGRASDVLRGGERSDPGKDWFPNLVFVVGCCDETWNLEPGMRRRHGRTATNTRGRAKTYAPISACGIGPNAAAKRTDR